MLISFGSSRAEFLETCMILNFLWGYSKKFIFIRFIIVLILITTLLPANFQYLIYALLVAVIVIHLVHKFITPREKKLKLKEELKKLPNKDSTPERLLLIRNSQLERRAFFSQKEKKLNSKLILSIWVKHLDRLIICI